jgi:hypothetical protein
MADMAQHAYKPTIEFSAEAAGIDKATYQAAKDRLKDDFLVSGSRFYDFSLQPIPELHILVVIDITISLSDILTNLISSALYDVLKSVLTGRDTEDTEVRLEFVLRDEKGQPVGYVQGRTRNPRDLKQMTDQVSNAVSQVTHGDHS